MDDKKTSDKRNEMLVKLGIYELRGLARSLGVQSPTTKRRLELIEMILEKLKLGKVEGEIINRQGRPAKTLFGTQALIEKCKLASLDETEERKFGYDDFLVFSQEIPSFQFQHKEEYFVYGVVRNAKEVYFFKDMENMQRTVYIPADIISEYKLECGDMVRGHAKKKLDREDYLFKRLESLNGVLVKNLAPRQILREVSGERVIPYKPIGINTKTPMFEGGRYMIEYSDITSRFTEAAKLFKDLGKLGYKVIIIALSIPYEQKIMLDRVIKEEKFITLYDDLIENGFNKLIDAISYMNALERDGNKVFVVVLDIVGILNILDLYFSSIEDKVKAFGRYGKSVVVLKKLMAMNKARENDTSTTLLVAVYTEDVSDPVFINEVKKICKEIGK